MNQTVAKDALENLVRDGYFTRRADGWCFASAVPSKRDLDWFVRNLQILAAYTVGDNAPVEITRGGETPFGLMWKLRDLNK